MHESHLCNSVKYAQQLHSWYASPAGQILGKELEDKVEQLLPNLFGYYALQVGDLCNGVDLLSGSTIGQKTYMAVSPNQGDVTASPLALPFPQDTLDLIVLPHTLDLSHDSHQVLREVHRVLIPEGHIVLIAFNPMSMMGLCRLALIRSKRVPWAGHFYTARRLKDWLALLDFTTLAVMHVGMRPPIQNLSVQQRLEFLQNLDRCGMSRFGSVQLFVARKRVITLTRRPQPWRPRSRITPVNVTEPTARQVKHVESGQYIH